MTITKIVIFEIFCNLSRKKQEKRTVFTGQLPKTVRSNVSGAGGEALTNPTH